MRVVSRRSFFYLMKFKYSLPVLFAVALLAGEAGSNLDRFLSLIPQRLYMRDLKSRFAIRAPSFPLKQVVAAVAKKHQVKPRFIKSIIAAESGFKQDAVSPKGAIGLMQLMPETAHELGADPTIPEQNVDAGTRYLSWLLKRYAKHRNGMQRAIAAYNAGPGWVDKYHGIPPFPETEAYVTRVMKYYRRFEN